jgi:glutamate racemase
MFGIFDSGVGGLSVAVLLKKRFADAGFIYLGDTAHFPYGDKSKENIQDYAYKNTRFLLDQGATVIVIACHTASALAADYLRKEFQGIPIYDVITPTIKKVLRHNIGHIGIIGTRATIKSGVYERKINSHTVISQSCPLLVSLIEEGWISRPETFSILGHYLSPLKKQNIKGLILSCTHYSLIKEQIKRILGPQIKLIDPAEILVDSLNFDKDQLVWKKNKKEEFWVTDSPLRFQELSKIFLGREIIAKKLETWNI